MSTNHYVPAAASLEAVPMGAGKIDVTTCGYTDFSTVVRMDFGPIGMACTCDQAIDLGNALIRAAHHYRAAIAEAKTSQAVPA